MLYSAKAMFARCAVCLAVALFLQASACVVHHHGRSNARAGGDCPPGHRWSDGNCHSSGKGHDPNKHVRKGRS